MKTIHRSLLLDVAIRHSNLCRADFGVGLECAQGRRGTGRHWDEFGDIRGKPPQPGPTPGRGTFAELARSVVASVSILLTVARPQTSIQRLAWFRSCL